MIKQTHVPDFLRLGIIKRKLTRKEAKKITKEVMATKSDDPNWRATLAILKAIEVTNKIQSEKK